MSDEGYKVTLKDVHSELKELRLLVESRIDEIDKKSNHAFWIATGAMSLTIILLGVMLRAHL